MNVLNDLEIGYLLFHQTIMGCSRKNPHPPDGWDSGNSCRRGGQGPWKSRREGGLNSKKVFCRGHLNR